MVLQNQKKKNLLAHLDALDFFRLHQFCLLGHIRSQSKLDEFMFGINSESEDKIQMMTWPLHYSIKVENPVNTASS